MAGYEPDIEVENTCTEDCYEFEKEHYIKWYMTKAKVKGSDQNKILVRVKTDTFENDKQRENFCNVLKFQTKNHKHLGMAKFDRLIRDSNGLDIYLVQRFNQYGLMKNLIDAAYEKERPFKEDLIKRWMAYLVIAVNGLHEQGMMHGNIHVSNLFMDKDELYLGPSERFIRLIEDPKSFVGRGDIWNWKSQDLDELERSNYTPPESLMQTKGSSKKGGAGYDIWCIGVAMHYTASCTYPFQGSTPGSVEEKVKTQPPNFVHFETRSPEFKEIIRRCLDKNEATRASVNELMAHPFLQPVLEEIMFQGQFSQMKC